MNARACCGLILALMAFGLRSGRTVGPTEFEKELHPPASGTILRERSRDRILAAQQAHRLRASVPRAVGDKVEHAPSALPLPPLVKPVAPTFFKGREDHVRLGAVALLLSILAGRILAHHRRDAEIRRLSGGYLSDARDIAGYTMPEWFTAPPPEYSARAALDTLANPSSRDEMIPAPLMEFFKQAPEDLAKIRELLKEYGGLSELEPRQQTLRQLLEVISQLQTKSNCWELRPAWQLSSALEMLIKRIADKPKDATASVMRTIVSAVDLLYELCVPGVRPYLITEPPIRILAVDDDALCRRALQVALDKASLSPDLAESGAQAVGLAMQHSYDVVFMDIQMPGIDGLTACTQIHKTERNSDVPVIFVTVQSDFNTRAQSRLKGGTDVMAKPYLMFELTVKAVTYAMRKRLQLADSKRREPITHKAVIPTLQLFTEPAPVTHPRAPRQSEKLVQPAVQAANAPAKWNGDFFAGVGAFLSDARKNFELMGPGVEMARLQELAGALYLCVHAIGANAASAKLPVTSQVASTLEALLKRLYKNPRIITVSTRNTVSNALALLDRLCIPGVEEKLAFHPPVRLLVVEDEPLARRAVVGALQLAFEKPMSANDGAEGLTLVATHSYDVIFTDVEMPGMNGFELCSAIRESSANCDTPVVFITNCNDAAAQERAKASGGNDFIGKPFLPIEITVKALTLTWHARWLKVEKSAVSTSPVPDELIVPATLVAA